LPLFFYRGKIVFQLSHILNIAVGKPPPPDGGTPFKKGAL